MSEKEIKKIADAADMIIKGYAFTRDGDLVRVFNINDGKSAMVITSDGMMVGTNMDDIEQALVLNIWNRDSKYMGCIDA